MPKGRPKKKLTKEQAKAVVKSIKKTNEAGEPYIDESSDKPRK